MSDIPLCVPMSCDESESPIIHIYEALNNLDNLSKLLLYLKNNQNSKSDNPNQMIHPMILDD